MRRKDRAVTEKEAIEILIKGEHGILSMCTPENEGYGIPLNYVLENHQIYFHSAAAGSKLDYLRTNNKVSFCVVGNTTVVELFEELEQAGKCIPELGGKNVTKRFILKNAQWQCMPLGLKDAITTPLFSFHSSLNTR